MTFRRSLTIVTAGMAMVAFVLGGLLLAGIDTPATSELLTVSFLLTVAWGIDRDRRRRAADRTASRT